MYQGIDALQMTIKRLCQEKGISINKLATLSGITQSTIDSIMKGRSRNPKLETLRKISKGFNMEYEEFISCLRGYENELRPPAIEYTPNDSKIGTVVLEKIIELRKSKGVALYDVYKAAGLPIDYEEMIKSPYFKNKNLLDYLFALCQFFNISADFLLGLTDIPAPLTPVANPEINPPAPDALANDDSTLPRKEPNDE